MKILVFTDSLGLPRDTPQAVNWEETWVQLLSKIYCVEYCAIGGAKVSDLSRQIAYYKIYNPDIVLVQSGIVDCAPRALSEFEKNIIDRFAILKAFFQKYLTKERLKKYRNNRNITLTSVSDFKNNISNFKNNFEEKLFWLHILPITEDYEALVPGVMNNTELFNNAIDEVLMGNVIKLNKMNKECLMSDYHHPNKEGHQYIFNEVNNKIKKYLV